MNHSKFWLITGLIIIAVLSRVIPHPFNVTPLIAVSLFAGAKFQDKKWAIIIPVISFFISDAILAYTNHYDLFHNTILFTYSSMILIVLLGRYLNKRSVNIGKTIGFSLAASLIFFIISNFGVWLFGNLYSINMAGLIQCYVMAIPFNKFSWLGDLFFVIILFGIYEFINNRFFVRSKKMAKQAIEKD